ncbi:MAG: sialate O-acetylesterase [Planctomycetota bacterium]
MTRNRSLVARLFLLLAAAVLLAGPVLAQGLRLPVVIGDHMVLQRGGAVPVWGWAEPGAEVSVEFKGQTKTATAGDDGKWRVDLDAMDASAEPAEMTIVSGNQTIKVLDILVGDVWLCSGQSNMEWRIKQSANPQQEIANANWPQIRHIATPHTQSMTPQDDANAQWTVCSPQTAENYTAVGYYFARRLHQELGVPIGLLNCTWGGTRIEPWTPVSGFAKVEQTRGIYVDTVRRLPGTELFRQLDAEDPNQALGPLPPYNRHQQPTMLYNAMMAPLVPYAIKGSIWYQGEANRADGMEYFYKTRALVEGWREVWENPELPYYFVQIAPFRYGNDDPNRLPELWEAQSRVEREINHTGMVVISDIGNINDIHPKNKQDVGLRLANLALHQAYGRSELVFSGPRFDSIDARGDEGVIVVTFTQTAAGLKSRDGQSLTHFEVAGADGTWHPADAAIMSANPIKVIVSSDAVAEPVAVRLGWHKTAEPNLMNSAGLPASPFRAGELPD